MAVEPKRYRFMRNDDHRMARAGIFEPDVRVELIDGEIIEMSAIGSRRMAAVNRLNYLFLPRLLGAAIVQVQGSIAPAGRSPRLTLTVDDVFAPLSADA